MSQPRYQVLERIDAGGMAEVFKANSTSMHGFQKLVAIKRVLPTLTKNDRFVRMFLDEAKISLHLNHTNCVHIFELGIADGTYFIVMEFVEGTNLKTIIETMARRREAMPIEYVTFVAIEILKGLSHAHNKSDLQGRPLVIVHRDISPPNVLVSREGEVKITDFGLAKAAVQAELTDPGVVKGKFGYLSPEAATGRPVDQRTDIFAVGIMLWEMLANQRLFLGKNDYETLKQVQSARIKPLSQFRTDIPHQLERIIARALSKDAERRYQDAESLVHDLAEFMYSYGRPVTSFSIANLVQEVLLSGKPRQAEQQDKQLNAAIQREINKLVSLEEVDDLDLYLAQNYSVSSEDDEEVVHNHSGVFEDPSMWADFGGDDDGGFLVDAPAQHPNADSSWQETGLNELAKSASGSYEAHREPPTDPMVRVARRPAAHTDSLREVQRATLARQRAAANAQVRELVQSQRAQPEEDRKQDAPQKPHRRAHTQDPSTHHREQTGPHYPNHTGGGEIALAHNTQILPTANSAPQEKHPAIFIRGVFVVLALLAAILGVVFFFI
ncbi:MAG: serine/threonine-protein kinase [Myxococcota bacterium]